jgi:hypothetical protein
MLEYMNAFHAIAGPVRQTRISEQYFKNINQ